jgi:hypothetical protein
MGAEFLVEDESHAEWIGWFSSFSDAVREVRRLAAIPWDEDLNRAPCMSWRTCGRDYEIVEFDDSVRPWIELRRLPILAISAEGARWASEFESEPPIREGGQAGS